MDSRTGSVSTARAASQDISTASQYISTQGVVKGVARKEW